MSWIIKTDILVFNRSINFNVLSSIDVSSFAPPCQGGPPPTHTHSQTHTLGQFTKWRSRTYSFQVTKLTKTRHLQNCQSIYSLPPPPWTPSSLWNAYTFVFSPVTQEHDPWVHVGAVTTVIIVVVYIIVGIGIIKCMASSAPWSPYRHHHTTFHVQTMQLLCLTVPPRATMESSSNDSKPTHFIVQTAIVAHSAIFDNLPHPSSHDHSRTIWSCEEGWGEGGEGWGLIVKYGGMSNDRSSDKKSHKVRFEQALFKQIGPQLLYGLPVLPLPEQRGKQQ